MNVLVTGGAGFIGSHFIRYMLKKYSDCHMVNLDKLTYAGNLQNLADIADNNRYTFVRGDICNRELVEYIIQQYRIDVIVNFAAESHVDRSIMDPEIFVKTNVLGTQTLLDAAKAYTVSKFVQISTDEVYGSLNETGLFTEDTPLAPNSPYAASKAAADMIVRSYYQTFGMNVNITRCSNNYGPYHYPEKLIPLMITNALENKPLPVYGDGSHIRDWLHVQDHCAAIDLVIQKGKAGEIYNIGGHGERKNIEIVDFILKTLGKSRELIRFVADRPGHDKRYAMDPRKIMTRLGWRPQYTLETGLKETIRWYIENENWWKPIKNGQYQEYYERQYGETRKWVGQV
jgi:dTDP-glucose 4,6-dehydratase